MSLMIDVSKVSAVLIAGDWHSVYGNSFSVAAYEFVQNSSSSGHFEVLYTAGTDAVMSSYGYSFRTGPAETISGPLAAIQALRQQV